MAKLNALSYVQTKALTIEDAKLLSEIQEAVEEINAVQAGELEARDIEELLNEL